VFLDILRFAEGRFRLEYSISAATASNTGHTAGDELIVTSRKIVLEGLIRRSRSVARCWISRRNGRAWRRVCQPNPHKTASTQRRTRSRTPVDEYLNGTTMSRLSRLVYQDAYKYMRKVILLRPDNEQRLLPIHHPDRTDPSSGATTATGRASRYRTLVDDRPPTDEEFECYLLRRGDDPFGPIRVS